MTILILNLILINFKIEHELHVEGVCLVIGMCILYFNEGLSGILYIETELFVLVVKYLIIF